MRAWRLVCQLGIMGGLVAAAIHCGTDNGSEFGDPAKTAACNAAYAGKCGIACNDNAGCAEGLYCSDSKVCTADCAPSVACDNAGQCTERGQCISGPGFTPVDSGPVPEGGTGNPDQICASTDVTLTKADPVVLFVIDQSGSMKYENFANTTTSRWDTLKTSLLGPTNNKDAGIVAQLQTNTQLGMALYSATSGSGSELTGTVEAVCPRFNGRSFANAFPGGLTFALNNANAIEALLRPANIDDDTPTGFAVQTLVGLANDGGVATNTGFAGYDAGAAPKVLILVTDGQAGNCVNATTSDNATSAQEQTNGYNKTLAMVQATYGQNIRTFVIDLSGSTDATSLSRFKTIANAGVGQPANGDATAFQPTSGAALAQRIGTIVSNARSCNFALNGEVVGNAASGTVLVNGQAVPYVGSAGGNGWRLADTTHIELVGTTCDLIKNNPSATLSASFPCGVVRPAIP